MFFFSDQQEIEHCEKSDFSKKSDFFKEIHDTMTDVISKRRVNAINLRFFGIQDLSWTSAHPR